MRPHRGFLRTLRFFPHHRRPVFHQDRIDLLLLPSSVALHHLGRCLCCLNLHLRLLNGIPPSACANVFLTNTRFSQCNFHLHHNFIFHLQKPLKCTSPHSMHSTLGHAPQFIPFPTRPPTQWHHLLPCSPRLINTFFTHFTLTSASRLAHFFGCFSRVPSSKDAETGKHPAHASLCLPAACNRAVFGRVACTISQHYTPIPRHCAHLLFAFRDSNIFPCRPPICPRLLLPPSVELASRRSAPRRVSLHGPVSL